MLPASCRQLRAGSPRSPDIRVHSNRIALWLFRPTRKAPLTKEWGNREIFGKSLVIPDKTRFGMRDASAPWVVRLGLAARRVLGNTGPLPCKSPNECRTVSASGFQDQSWRSFAAARWRRRPWRSSPKKRRRCKRSTKSCR